MFKCISQYLLSECRPSNLIHRKSFFQVMTERLPDMTRIACLQASSIHPAHRAARPSVATVGRAARISPSAPVFSNTKWPLMRAAIYGHWAGRLFSGFEAFTFFTPITSR